MDKSYKKPLLLITFGVILFAAFNNLNYVANFLKSCIGLLAPILSGLLLAFVLSVPVRGLAKRLRRKLTKATDRQIDMISQLLHESIERRLHTRKPELSNVQSNSDENTDISQ